MVEKNSRLITVRVSADLYERVQEASLRSCRPVSSVIRAALEKWAETEIDFVLDAHPTTIVVEAKRAATRRTAYRKGKQRA